MPDEESPSKEDGLFDFDRKTMPSGKWAGVDEAGRGPLAGPVVAAAVLLTQVEGLTGLNDSKKLTPKKRRALYHEIISRHVVGVGFADEREIDTVNILQASLLAMKRAVLDLPVSPEGLLIDGTFSTELPLPQKTVIDGDAKSASIAAASVVAKVLRDAWMEKRDLEYPLYGFARHKGYGTPQHLDALSRYGACPIHRRSFDPVRKCLAPGFRPIAGEVSGAAYEN
jgi:ribonuclease HII